MSEQPKKDPFGFVLLTVITGCLIALVVAVTVKAILWMF